MRLAAMVLLMLAAAFAQAQEPRPFVRGALQSIVDEYRERPFVLAVWSLDCVYCRHDLALLASIQARHPQLIVVTVSTDSPDHSDEISTVLTQLGLGGAPAWVFADRFVERLRFEIDDRWLGELPRTYFYAPDGSRIAVSGKLDRENVEQWLAAVSSDARESPRKTAAVPRE